MIGCDKNRIDEIVRHGLAFVLRLALILGGLGFASVYRLSKSACYGII